MKRMFSLAIIFILIVSIFSSYQIVQATSIKTIELGKTTTFSINVTKPVSSGKWHLSGNTDAVEIVSQTPYSCKVKAVALTESNPVRLTCFYNLVSGISPGQYNCDIEVVPPTPDSVTITPGYVEIAKGDKKQLVATLSPEGVTTTLEWSSSSDAVSVDSDGEISAIEEGYAKVTVTTANGKTDTCAVWVRSVLEEIDLEPQITTLVGESSQLDLEFSPSTAGGFNTEWLSSDSSVVEIVNSSDKWVNLQAVSEGTATITASANGKTATCTVTVKRPKPEAVMLPAEITVYMNKPHKLEAEIHPAEAINTVTWSSANRKIATVADDGTVTGLKAGTVTIKARTINGLTAKCKLTVLPRIAQNIVVSEFPVKTYGDDGFVIEVTPDETANLSSFFFESSNTDVAEVSAEGTVTVKAAGETDITIKEHGNDEYAEFIKTQKLLVNKKSVEIKSIDLENETAVFDGFLDTDTGIELDFKSLKLEVVDSDDTNADVKVTNFVLHGEKADNYTVSTKMLETVVSADRVVTVSAVAENGSVEGTGSYVKGSEVTVKAVADKGYKFGGWYVDKKQVSTKEEYTFVADKDITLVANFKKYKSKSSGGSSGSGSSGGKVSGSIGGGVSSGAVSHKADFVTGSDTTIPSQSISSKGVVKKPEAPSKNGFAFDGWYIDKEYTSEYDFNTEVTKNITLYAKWADPKTRIVLKIDDKKAMVFGEEKENDVAPKIVNSRTMLPIRFVAENLGAEVIWHVQESDKVVVKNKDVEIVIYIGSDKAFVNGNEVILDSTAFVENDRTYLPLRFVSENLGASVRWDGDSREVVITKKQ